MAGTTEGLKGNRNIMSEGPNSLEKMIKTKAWGDKVLAIVAARLQQELPGLRGFSTSNLKKMRLFYNAWAAVSEIGSSLTNQLENHPIELSSSLTSKLENAVKGSTPSITG